MFGGGNTVIETPKIGSLRFQDQGYGARIPVVMGTNRVHPVLIWYSNFKAIKHTETQGSKGGGSTTTSVWYTYKAAIMLLACEAGGAGIVGFGKMWRDKKVFDSPTDRGLTEFVGSDAQTAWGWLSTNHPTKALAYQGHAYVAASGYKFGTTPSLGNHSLEIYGLHSTLGTPDATVENCITEFLTNAQWGVGFSIGKIGDLSAMDDYCSAYGLRISPALVDAKPAHEYLTNWARIANAGIVWSGGALKFIPYSDVAATGYTPPTATGYHLTDDDFIVEGDEDPVICTPRLLADRYNHVQVEYLDRANDYNKVVVDAKDQANIEEFGLRTMPIVKLHEVCTAARAQLVADTILQRSLYIVNTYEFKLSWNYSLLEPMDIVTITDTQLGLNQEPVRITKISDDEILRITAEEMPYGASQGGSYSSSSTDVYKPAENVEPTGINTPIVFAAPEQQTTTGYEVWCAISSDDENFGGCEVWASYDDATYSLIGVHYGSSIQGVLTASLSAGSDPDTVNTLSVDLSESLGELTSVTQTVTDLFDALCLVGNEFVSFRDAALTGNYTYDLTYLRRGVYGSTQGASNGARFVRCDSRLFRFTYDPFKSGNTVYLKFPAFNVFGDGLQDISTLTPVTFTFAGVQWDNNASIWDGGTTLWES
jgi:hypothetical protein